LYNKSGLTVVTRYRTEVSALFIHAGRNDLKNFTIIMQELDQDQILNDLTTQEYKFGFTTDVVTDVIDKGLNEEVIRLISLKKGEPEWLLEFRLKAYRHWLTMKQPEWAHLKIPPIDFQNYLLCRSHQT